MLPGRETLSANASACLTEAKLGASFLPSPLTQLTTAAHVPLARTSINLLPPFTVLPRLLNVICPVVPAAIKTTCKRIGEACQVPASLPNSSDAW